MLEQRRAKEKGYITLKEAAVLSGYSSDYVGQLIRADKIRGTQVYSGVAWMTTEAELKAYLSNKQRKVINQDSEAGFDLNELVRSYRFKFLRYRTTFYIVLFGSAFFASQFAILNAEADLELPFKQLTAETKEMYE